MGGNELLIVLGKAVERKVSSNSSNLLEENAGVAISSWFLISREICTKRKYKKKSKTNYI